MKTTKILASGFIFFALNVNSFATDTSDKLLNTIEANKQGIASVLINHGRNNHLRSHQDNTVLQLVDTQNDEVVFTEVQPKGRNLETMDRIEEEGASYAKAGRNKSTVHEMISMN